MTVQPSIAALMLLAIMVLVPVGGLALLLANKKTRPAGLALSVVLVVFVVFVVLFGGFLVADRAPARSHGVADVGLLLATIMVLILMGGLATLLAYRRTRPAGLGLSAVLVLFVLVMGSYFSVRRGVRRQAGLPLPRESRVEVVQSEGGRLTASEQQGYAPNEILQILQHEPSDGGRLTASEQPALAPADDATPNEDATPDDETALAEDATSDADASDAETTSESAAGASEGGSSSGDEDGQEADEVDGVFAPTSSTAKADGTPSQSTSAAAEPAASDEPVAAARKRPAWVDAEPGREGGVYRRAVVIGPYSTRSECEKERSQRVSEAVDEYTVALIGSEARGRVRLPWVFLAEHVVQEQWFEEKEYGYPVGPMLNLHVLLGFDRDANRKIEESWRQAVVSERLLAIGVLGGVVLLLLSVVYAYLKADLATGGAYRWRLRLTAGAMVLMLIGGVVLLTV